MVDDAIGETFAMFHKGETIRAAMITLWEYIYVERAPEI